VTTVKKAKYVIPFLLAFSLFYTAIQYLVGDSGCSLVVSLDNLIPFIPEFVWVYHTLIPTILFTTIILIKTKKEFFVAYNACLLATIVLFTFFVLMPSHYPRFMIEDHYPDLSLWLVKLTHIIDKANNTFPSTHVTFSCLMFLTASNTLCLKDYPLLKLLYFIWALLVFSSTLFLKQHYIADVVFGVVLACACYYLSRRSTKILNPHEDA